MWPSFRCFTSHSCICYHDTGPVRTSILKLLHRHLCCDKHSRERCRLEESLSYLGSGGSLNHINRRRGQAILCLSIATDTSCCGGLCTAQNKCHANICDWSWKGAADCDLCKSRSMGAALCCVRWYWTLIGASADQGSGDRNRGARTATRTITCLIYSQSYVQGFWHQLPLLLEFLVSPITYAHRVFDIPRLYEIISFLLFVPLLFLIALYFRSQKKGCLF